MRATTAQTHIASAYIIRCFVVNDHTVSTNIPNIQSIKRHLSVTIRHIITHHLLWNSLLSVVMAAAALTHSFI